mmetsp:Transcript_4920/g.9810  ORF Transcript_4920/g.9810 Transcript_4920/m.9810 type:complete len:98 (-) Transcript_4920:119-412(-)
MKTGTDFCNALCEQKSDKMSDYLNARAPERPRYGAIERLNDRMTDRLDDRTAIKRQGGFVSELLSDRSTEVTDGLGDRENKLLSSLVIELLCGYASR